MSSRTSRVVNGTLMTFVQYGLQIVLQASLAPLVLSMAGQEVLGAFSILTQLISWLALIDLGFGPALNRYLSQAFGTDNPQYVAKVLSIARTFWLFSNFVFALLCILLSFYISDLLSLSNAISNETRISLYIWAVWIVVRTPLMIYSIALWAGQDLAAYNGTLIIGLVTRMLLSVVFVVLGFSLVGLILANMFGELLKFAIAAWRFRRTYHRITLRWGISDIDLFAAMFRFGLQSMPILLAGRLIGQTDNLIVGTLYGAAAASIYYTTQMPAMTFHQLLLRLTDNANPAINELYVREMWDSLHMAYLRLQRYTLMLCAGTAIYVLTLMPVLIGLWVGKEQFAGYSMVVALAVFITMNPLGYVNFPFITATGRISTYSELTICEGVANVTFSFLLGHFFGLPGVMWATVLANMSTSFYMQWKGQRIVQVSFIQIPANVVSPVILPGALGILAIGACWMLMPLNTWPGLAFATAVFAVIYGASAFCFALSGDERKQFLSIVKALLLSGKRLVSPSFVADS